MSKYSAPTLGEAISPDSHKTRRTALRVLVGASALTIPTVSSIVAAVADPIIAAVERHKATYSAALALSFAIDDVIHDPEGGAVSDAEWDALERARKHEQAAFDALLAGVPETVDGMRAIITHLVEIDDGRLSQKMRQLLALILKSRILSS